MRAGTEYGGVNIKIRRCRVLDAVKLYTCNYSRNWSNMQQPAKRTEAYLLWCSCVGRVTYRRQSTEYILRTLYSDN